MVGRIIRSVVPPQPKKCDTERDKQIKRRAPSPVDHGKSHEGLCQRGAERQAGTANGVG